MSDGDGDGLLLNLTGGDWQDAPVRKRKASHAAAAAHGHAQRRRVGPAGGERAGDGWLPSHARRAPPERQYPRTEARRVDPIVPMRAVGAAVVPSLSARAVQDVFGPPAEADGALADSFDAFGLPTALVSRLSALKYTRPTRVQQRTIATLMSRRDVLVRSDTGSGKTLAYLVPAVSHLITQEPRINRLGGTAALVLAPTRELCIQIFGCLQALLLPFHWVVPGAVMGGENRQKEKARLRRGVSFLVATPGRLLDHLKSTESFSVQPLSWLVLDEADRLLDLGFEAALTEILSLLQERAGTEGRCTALLSATLPKSLLKLVRIALREPLSIDVAAEDVTVQPDEADGAPGTLSIPQQLSQTFVTVPCRLRLVALVAALRTWLCRGVQRVVVFVSTCQAVDFYADLLPQLEANGDVLLPTRLFKLHGMLPQSERTQNFRDFQTADTGILLCTDVAARGLDFPAVGAALQVDPPGLPEEYVHRIGRTARVGPKGEALIFLLPTESPYADLLASRGAHLAETKLCTLLGALPGGAGVGRLGNAIQVAELHPAALTMLKRVEAVTSSNADVRKVAKDAFRAHVRAYAAHPSVAKSIFHVKRLHLGHLAASFGLKQTPVLLGKSTPGSKVRYAASVYCAASDAHSLPLSGSTDAPDASDVTRGVSGAV